MDSVTRPKATLALTALMGGLLLASCVPASSPSSEAQTATATADQAGQQMIGNQAALPLANEAALSRSQPQLVKMAKLVITVESIRDGIDRARTIGQQHQGEVLSLQDQTPTDPRSPRTAALQLRVPQAKLDAILQALKGLGTVQSQTLSAKDVADQLVDLQARLRNLRRSEQALLEIMDRSGSVGDVLKVAQELSATRSLIEQIEAQRQTLQNRVAYSTVDLELKEPIAAILPQRAVQTQLQETWQHSTQSLRQFTVSLLQLGIWLLVYSPYWLLLVSAAALLYRLKSRPSQMASNSEPPLP